MYTAEGGRKSFSQTAILITGRAVICIYYTLPNFSLCLAEAFFIAFLINIRAATCASCKMLMRIL